MKLFLFQIFFILSLAGTVFSQGNLVSNPSFEEHSSCPYEMWQINFSTYWTYATLCPPEYFNTCGSGNVIVPQNVGGFEFAHSGQAYAGIYGFYNQFNIGQGYLESQLLDTLIADSKYYIEFFISLADSFSISTTHLGMYISDTAFDVNNYNTLPFTPQIMNTTLAQVTNKDSWSKISGYYTAHGGEKYIIIGNFNPNPYADTVFVNHAKWDCCAYYYIDDVYVGLDTTVSVNKSQKEPSYFNVYPNPSSGKIQLKYMLPQNQNCQFIISNCYGEILKKINFNNKQNETSLMLDLLDGVYYYQVISDNKVLYSDKLVIIK